jgi:hypothetical protein
MELCSEDERIGITYAYENTNTVIRIKVNNVFTRGFYIYQELTKEEIQEIIKEPVLQLIQALESCDPIDDSDNFECKLCGKKLYSSKIFWHNNDKHNGMFLTKSAMKT